MGIPEIRELFNSKSICWVLKPSRQAALKLPCVRVIRPYAPGWDILTLPAAKKHPGLYSFTSPPLHKYHIDKGIPCH
jgi:hypothetical protein